MMAFAPMDLVTRNWGGGTGSVTGSHNYMKAGSYSVTLTVTDDDSYTTPSSSAVVVDKPK